MAKHKRKAGKQGASRTEGGDADAESSLQASPVPAVPVRQDLPGTLSLSTSDQLIHLFSLRTILTRPVYMAASPWLEHVPFAFWLVEALSPRLAVEVGTHTGVSYFAVCQAAERLAVDMRAFALCAPAISPQMADQMRTHNEALYSGFSRLIEPGADSVAPPHFAPGSIDLLHLETSKGTTALAEVFETWAPLLSDRAVLLLHGTNLREGAAAAARFLDSLRGRVPIFEFHHGDGLAVIGVGPAQDASLARLFAAEADTAARQAIHAMFSRLGRASADAQSLRETRTRFARAEAEIARLTAALTGQPLPEAEGAALPGPGALALQPMLAAIEAERESYRTHIARLTQAHQDAADQAQAAQGTVATLREEAETLRASLARAEAEAAARLRTATAALRQEAQDARAADAAERAALAAQLDEARLEVAGLRAAAGIAADQAEQRLQQALRTAAGQQTAPPAPDLTTALDAARAQLAEAQSRIADLTGALAETDDLRVTLRERSAEVSALTQMVFDLQKDAQSVDPGILDRLRTAQAAAKSAQARLATLEAGQAAAAEAATQTEAALRAELALWQGRHEAVLRSTSWRVSAPVRAVSRLIRRRPS